MSHRGGLGLGRPRRRIGGTSFCVCPNCGYKTKHKRGVPCSSIKCPKCGSPMAGYWG